MPRPAKIPIRRAPSRRRSKRRGRCVHAQRKRCSMRCSMLHAAAPCTEQAITRIRARILLIIGRPGA
jgi:hypothetical protein